MRIGLGFLRGFIAIYIPMVISMVFGTFYLYFMLTRNADAFWFGFNNFDGLLKGLPVDAFIMLADIFIWIDVEIYDRFVNTTRTKRERERERSLNFLSLFQICGFWLEQLNHYNVNLIHMNYLDMIFSKNRVAHYKFKYFTKPSKSKAKLRYPQK